MKKYLHLSLLILVFAGFANAQGLQSTANWFGYELPPNPAANKYITFTMQDLGSVSVASDIHPQAVAATFADGYVWSANNNNNSYSICKSRFNAANNLIEEPEMMIAGVSYITDMEYNPADGLIYIIMEEHLKSFDPNNPNNIQDHGAIEHDGFNLAIDMEGNAYMISSWGEYGLLNLSNAQLNIINPIDLPLRMSFDMMTGELFGIHYGNLYQIDPNTGAYTMLGALHDGSVSYDPSFMFMTYGFEPTEFTVGDLNYRVNDDNISVTVIGHVNGYEATGDLIIPESVSYEENDYAVTTIGENAFASCYDLTGDLTIPSSVQTIGPSAFFDCQSLDGTLTIGESVTFIGDMAFRNCSSFTGAVSLATTPPVLDDEFGGMVFENFGYPILTVPCECGEAYQNSRWYDPYGMNGFNEFIEDCYAISEANGIVTAAYPNPTNGLIKIEAENIHNISIFNILGEKVFESSANGDVFEYDFSHQNAGIYFIKVETAKGVETIRITVR